MKWVGGRPSVSFCAAQFFRESQTSEQIVLLLWIALSPKRSVVEPQTIGLFRSTCRRTNLGPAGAGLTGSMHLSEKAAMPDVVLTTTHPVAQCVDLRATFAGGFLAHEPEVPAGFSHGRSLSAMPRMCPPPNGPAARRVVLTHDENSKTRPTVIRPGLCCRMQSLLHSWMEVR
jgi:hypothetical protein